MSILTQQPPNKQNTLATISRHQEPLTPRRHLPPTPMVTNENQDPTITAPVFSLGTAFGGITATQTIQTCTTTTTTRPGPASRAAAALIDQIAAPADVAAAAAPVAAAAASTMNYIMPPAGAAAAAIGPALVNSTAQKTHDVKPKTQGRK